MNTVQEPCDDCAITGRRPKIALGVLALMLALSTEACVSEGVQHASLAGAPTTPSHSAWLSCDAVQRVAFRLVPPGVNPHNEFTQPVRVKLGSSQTCADFQ
jgi:hypothetical protein